MKLNLHTAALFAATLAMGAATSTARAETIPLGDGSTVTIDEYLIETDAEGRKLVVIRMRPDFDPEPYGPVPSDDFARVFEQLCENLVANSWDQLQAEQIGGVRVRWDFSPSQVNQDAAAAGITMSRFHEGLFEVRRDRSCLAMPLGVGLDNLAPPIPSGAPAKLEYIERGADPGDLRLTYRYSDNLLEADPAMLDRSAIELCIVHADPVLATRAQYYGQLASRTVTIVFHRDQGDGHVTERQVRFPVRDGACATGLSPMLTDAIRQTAGG